MAIVKNEQSNVSQMNNSADFAHKRDLLYEDSIKDYEKSMKDVNAGFSRDIMNKGTLEEKQDFMMSTLNASITGKQLAQRTGKPYKVPDITCDDKGDITISVQEYNPKQQSMTFERSSKTLNNQSKTLNSPNGKAVNAVSHQMTDKQSDVSKSEDVNPIKQLGNRVKNMGIGAVVGSTVGTLGMPGIGTAVGAAGGAVVGSVVNKVKNGFSQDKSSKSLDVPKAKNGCSPDKFSKFGIPTSATSNPNMQTPNMPNSSATLGMATGTVAGAVVGRFAPSKSSEKSTMTHDDRVAAAENLEASVVSGANIGASKDMDFENV